MRMNRYNSYPALVLIALVSAVPAFSQKADLLPPKSRDLVVERAAKFVGANNAEAASLPADLVNPFDPAASKIKPGPAQTSEAPVLAKPTLSDDQQLRALASRLAPTGTISLSGDAYLLFGQKKFKVGDVIPINFEGGTYNVLLTDVQSTSFTIRLGEAETVRPIKLPTK